MKTRALKNLFLFFTTASTFQVVWI